MVESRAGGRAKGPRSWRRWMSGMTLGIMLSTLLGACGGAGNSNTGSGSSNSAGTAGKEPAKVSMQPGFENSGDNWQAHKGKTVRLLLVKHWWTDAILPRIPEFEKLTGIKVETDVLSEDSYFQKALVALSSGTSTYDGLMVGNLQVGQYKAAGWLTPLEEYLAKGKSVDAAWYNLDDVFAPGRAAGSLNGQLLALPISAEAEVIMYRKDLLEKAGIKEIRTFDDLAAAAAKVNSPDMAGIVGRGRRGLDIVWVWTGFFTSYGGKFYENGKPAVNSPAGIKATEMYVKTLLGKYGAKGTSNMGFLETTGLFNQGGAAMTPDASGLLSVVLDKSKNPHAANVAVFRWPSDGQNPARPNYWYWMVGMPKSSQQKDAAALFFAWATSKPTALAIGRATGTASARASVWADEEFRKFYPGDTATEIMENLKAVDPSLVPYDQPSFPNAADALSVELVNALTGSKSAEQAMKDAAEAMAKVAQ